MGVPPDSGRPRAGSRTCALDRADRLVVGWGGVEKRMVDFGKSPGVQKRRWLAAPPFASPPRVDHDRVVCQSLDVMSPARRAPRLDRTAS